MEAIISIDAHLKSDYVQEFFDDWVKENPNFKGEIELLVPPLGSLGADHSPKLSLTFTKIAELASIISLILALSASSSTQPNEVLEVRITTPTKTLELSIPVSGNHHNQLDLQLAELIDEQNNSIKIKVAVTKNRK